MYKLFVYKFLCEYIFNSLGTPRSGIAGPNDKSRNNFYYLLWQNMFNIKFTILTIFKCTVLWC